MKGAILESGMEKYTSLDIFLPIMRNEIISYNWLLTDIDSDYQSTSLSKNDYEFLTGEEFLDLIEQKNFTFVWGVLSAFPKDMEFERIISEGIPFADGYTGFWNTSISIQNSLAVTEIVFWDGILNLIISRNDELVDAFLELYKYGQDLEEYNNKKL